MKVEDFAIQPFAEGPTNTKQGGLSVKTRLVTPKMFVTGNEERSPVMLVQTKSGEATKRNKGKRSVLPHSHRQGGFKRLVQENPSGREHHNQNHEKDEKELTT